MHPSPNSQSGPIGIFDSGYGGLTILRDIRRRLPQYDYIYLGDNARAPYGTRSFDVVYRFTLEAVRYLFDRGCRLVILACNTASAKALRSIQQIDLPQIDPSRRVLGIIRPTVERLGQVSPGGHIGLLATQGTVSSRSYDLEIEKLYPDRRITLTSLAAPMWVPLIENGEADSPGADYFINKYIDTLLQADPLIDTLLLACTHFPIMYPRIRAALPSTVSIICQGNIVAHSLADYLTRHPEIQSRCTTQGSCTYLTTENPDAFSRLAATFLDTQVQATHVDI